MLKVGDKFMWKGDEARVMAIAEGYVMARKKGCYPFLEPLKDIEAKIEERRQTKKNIQSRANHEYGCRCSECME